MNMKYKIINENMIYIESVIFNFAIALSQFKNFSAVFTPEKVTFKNIEKWKHALKSVEIV